MEARRVIVAGRVQGVGFRWATMSEAVRLGVSGWVCNRPDGSVEALVQGEPAVVERMLDWLREGPPASRVTECRVVEAAPEGGLEGFHIRG
jgi:acylphosphatase